MSRAQAFANDFTGFGIFTSPSNPQDLSADSGTGDFDMPHRFVLIGVIEPASIAEGQPVSPSTAGLSRRASSR